MTEDEAKTKWAPVSGYCGLYEVSDTGEVRSVDRFKPYRDSQRVARGKPIRPTMVKGYPRVFLWYRGVSEACLVHLLVMYAFIGPRPSLKHQANHKNGNRADACVSNLEWVTASENLQHAYDQLGRTRAGGRNFGSANGRYKDGRHCGLAGAPQ